MGGQLAVDNWPYLSDNLVHLLLKGSILFDVRPRRHGNLQQDDLLYVLWVLCQQLLVGAGAIDDPFGVISRSPSAHRGRSAHRALDWPREEAGRYHKEEMACAERNLI